MKIEKFELCRIVSGDVLVCLNVKWNEVKYLMGNVFN